MASAAQQDEEDDYMNMTFGEEPAAPAAETSLQRRQRQRREGEERGRVKSKAEQAAAEREEREQALSRSLLETARARQSKGFAMMAKMGFRAGGALGKAPSPSAPGGDGDAVEKKDKNDADDRLFEPLRPEVRDGRGGIGLDSDRKRRLGEAAEDRSKKLKVDENEFRDRMRKDQMRGRLERQVHAAMKVCERMDDERGSGGAVAVEEDDEDDENDDEIEEKKKNKNKPFSTRPLKSIPVVWRGLARSREEAERDRRMRHDLEQSSSIAATRRLPTYEDDLSDDDDRVAMGREARPAAYAPVEDLDEDDAELDEFAALEPEERLRRLVVFLRDEHRYCFWCKCGYPDDDMDGCPGPTEEDHD